MVVIVVCNCTPFLDSLLTKGKFRVEQPWGWSCSGDPSIRALLFRTGFGGCFGVYDGLGIY